MNIKNKYWGNLAPIFLLPSFEGGNREIIIIIEMNIHTPQLNKYSKLKFIIYLQFTIELFTSFLLLHRRAGSRARAFFHYTTRIAKSQEENCKQIVNIKNPEITLKIVNFLLIILHKKFINLFFKKGLTNRLPGGIIVPESKRE